jgi:hypothetical protein
METTPVMYVCYLSKVHLKFNYTEKAEPIPNAALQSRTLINTLHIFTLCPYYYFNPLTYGSISSRETMATYNDFSYVLIIIELMHALC